MFKIKNGNWSKMFDEEVAGEAGFVDCCNKLIALGALNSISCC